MKSIYRNSLIGLLSLLSIVFMAADFPIWEVPSTANEVQNPVAQDKIAIEEGASLFKTQCTACHGMEGKGNGAIPSADLTSKAFQDQTDGAIFHKLVEGRGQMPSFKTLDENSRWKIIHFLRTLGGDQVQVVKKNAKLFLTPYDNKGGINKIIVNVKEQLDDGTLVPAAEAKVGIYVKRYFGLLPIGGTRHYTDASGNVLVDFPTNIPGDEGGNLTLVAKLEDSGFNPIEVSSAADWGTLKPASNWENERALWKTNEFVPYWVIFSILFFTLGTWAGIGYVLNLIRKIKKIGDVVS